MADLMPTNKTDIGTPERRLSEDARFICEDPALAGFSHADVNAEGVSKSPISSCVTVPGKNKRFISRHWSHNLIKIPVFLMTDLREYVRDKSTKLLWKLCQPTRQWFLCLTTMGCWTDRNLDILLESRSFNSQRNSWKPGL